MHPLTITSEETYHTIAARSLLQDSEVSLKIYTGDSIPVLGSALVQIEHGGDNTITSACSAWFWTISHGQRLVG